MAGRPETASQRQAAPSRSGAAEVVRPYAALDLGTNNCRMLIARPGRNGADRLGVVDSVSRTVSLGTDLERTGALSEAGIRRVLRTMHLCAARLRRHEVGRMHLVATEACRQARNGRELVRLVERETGLRLEIIPPEVEARLALTGCAPLVAAEAAELLVFDIGGGSTEFIWIDLAAVPPARRRRAVLDLAPLGRADPAVPGPGARILGWRSVPAGVATLHQRFQDVEEDRARFALMSCHFEELAEGFGPAPAASGALQVIGTSGTITTVAAAHLGLDRYRRERVDGLWIARTEVGRIIEQFLGLDPAARARHPAIGPPRAALIVAGIAILHAILRLWPVPRLRVADRGLREGILYALMDGDGVLPMGAV